MEKEFVPYELALRMKQLGFDEPCFAFYNGKHLDLDVWDWEYPAGQKRRNIGECPQAPLFQQAFRWFREKLKNSGLEPYDMVKNYSYNMKVSWEEAEAACLEKLLSIVEEKQKEI
jgi:hypothetical protein